ncbi:unnamed protein product [Cylicocyclus nassatus]|uniref:Uncharacterized protein n=1 Tax=Cylicocyclus nassatus TaxID=53992 RepID=A0AA36GGD1_CYLNA|nr:unnamed protein product [Cylicocyclus nassatus]
MGNLMARKNEYRPPRTIAEAKAEIVDSLLRIQEHYNEINRMRNEDRAKWKSLNKKVEILEAVKARALKEERQRLRDLERSKERDELQANLSKDIIITPYGASKEKIVYPNLNKQREEASKKKSPPLTMKTSSVPSADYGKFEFKRRLSKLPPSKLKRAKRKKMLKLDITQESAESAEKDKDEEDFFALGELPDGSGSASEELFVQVDRMIQESEKSKQRTRRKEPEMDRVTASKAKVVTMPIRMEISQSNEDARFSGEFPAQRGSKRFLVLAHLLFLASSIWLMWNVGAVEFAGLPVPGLDGLLPFDVPARKLCVKETTILCGTLMGLAVMRAIDGVWQHGGVSPLFCVNPALFRLPFLFSVLSLAGMLFLWSVRSGRMQLYELELAPANYSFILLIIVCHLLHFLPR